MTAIVKIFDDYVDMVIFINNQNISKKNIIKIDRKSYNSTLCKDTYFLIYEK